MARHAAACARLEAPEGETLCIVVPNTAAAWLNLAFTSAGPHQSGRLQEAQAGGSMHILRPVLRSGRR